MIEVKVQMPDTASVNVEGAVVKVPVYPSGEIDIDHNGEWNVAAYSTANVAVPTTAVLQDKSVTYTPAASVQTDAVSADDGYDGLRAVNVTVNPYTLENQSYTFTPSGSQQTRSFTPAGANGLGQVDITVNAMPPWNWVGDGVEKLSNCYSESTTLKAVGFDSWTATTTASTLRSGQAGTDISADMANYDYIIKWRCFWEAAYNAGATYYAIPVNGATEFYQILCRRPQTLSDVQSENYNQNTYAAFYTMNYQEYYNTSGIHVAAWSNAYGITFTVNAPTYSGGDTITISPLCPSVGARCNGSYFNTARKADIDSEHSTIKIIGEVYRVSKSALRSTYESMVDIANHGL